MSESSSADPFSTFLYNTSGHAVYHPGGLPVPVHHHFELPEEGWEVLRMLRASGELELTALRGSVQLTTRECVHLLDDLEGRGLVRVVPGNRDDIVRITDIGRTTLNEHDASDAPQP